MARTMADLGNRIWDDNEMQAFSTGENTRKYQDYKKQLEDDYDKNYSIGGNFLNWLGTGLSGGGWSKGDFLKNRGITDETDQYGNAGYFGNSSMGDLRSAGSEYNKGRLAQLEAGKGLFSGIPVIGDLLSAPTQVVSAGKDLAEGGLSKWQSGKRDWLSDVGALGETALDVATLGSGATAKTLGKTIGKGAALGAGYGLAGGLNEMGSENFDGGQLALNTLLGGAIGGGLAGAGYGLGKVWNKYSQPAPSKSTDIIPSATNSGGANNKYQEYMKTLTDNKLDTSSADALKKSYRKVIKPLHTDKAVEGTANEKLFKTIDEAYRAFYGKGGENYADAMAKATAPVVSSAPIATSAPTLSFAQKLKNFGSNIPNMGKDLANTKAGTKVANLLKTKKGKVLAGAGGGLLLAQLMKNNNNNNSNSGELTDEELQELYNYVYGGGE